MTGLELAIREAGSQVKLAGLIGAKQQNVSYWLKTRVPAEWCRPIHERTGVPLHLLRPDLYIEAA